MKVELTPTQTQEKQFEPFSVTFTFETEQEACNMWHRLDQTDLNSVRTEDVRLGFDDANGYSIWESFNKIMFEKGLSTLE